MRDETEAPFSGEYWDCKESGTYVCAACAHPLFSSRAKYDSGTGWPSFWEAIDAESVDLRPDVSHDMVRTEVCCGHCGTHLGHLFPDGPPPSGMRFCINSVALNLMRES